MIALTILLIGFFLIFVAAFTALLDMLILDFAYEMPQKIIGCCVVIGFGLIGISGIIFVLIYI